MIDKEKLNLAKVWIEKLANGINPTNDEPAKDDDIINNVHISRCLFYISELLSEIKAESIERKRRNPFFLSTSEALTIPITTPNGIANFVKIINGYIPTNKKTLAVALVIKWLKSENLLQEVQKADGHKTNLPTEEGIKLGITTEAGRTPEGLEYQRVVYSVEAQKYILSNIESIAKLQ